MSGGLAAKVDGGGSPGTRALRASRTLSAARGYVRSFSMPLLGARPTRGLLRKRRGRGGAHGPGARYAESIEQRLRTGLSSGWVRPRPGAAGAGAVEVSRPRVARSPAIGIGQTIGRLP